MPLDFTLSVAEGILDKQEATNYTDALKVWSSSLPAYVNGGTKVPDPPEVPEFMQPSLEDQEESLAQEEAYRKLMQTLL